MIWTCDAMRSVDSHLWMIWSCDDLKFSWCLWLVILIMWWFEHLMLKRSVIFHKWPSTDHHDVFLAILLDAWYSYRQIFHKWPTTDQYDVFLAPYCLMPDTLIDKFFKNDLSQTNIMFFWPHIAWCLLVQSDQHQYITLLGQNQKMSYHRPNMLYILQYLDNTLFKVTNINISHC